MGAYQEYLQHRSALASMVEALVAETDPCVIDTCNLRIKGLKADVARTWQKTMGELSHAELATLPGDSVRTLHRAFALAVGSGTALDWKEWLAISIPNNDQERPSLDVLRDEAFTLHGIER